MLDSKFRGKYQTLVIKQVLKIQWLSNVHPTHLTLCALLLGLCIPVLLPLGFILSSLLCLALSGFCDTLDGSLARHSLKTSDMGAALDITSDRIVEFSIVLGLFLVSPESRGLYCLLMLGSILFCITTFLVVGIFTQNKSEKSFHYSFGIIERAEAFLFFAVMFLFPSLFSPLAILFSLLVFMTGALRLFEFFTLCRKNY